MALYAYLGQVPAQWFSEAGDAALAGGVLRFYEVGTTTPKEVFEDYQGLSSAGTSVTLDASGRANIFWSGLFKVTLEDSEGNLIGNAIDGVGPGNLGSGGAVVYVGNYDAVRALGGGGEDIVVFVEGRVANGDGGAGVFVWDSLETSPDDGGTILAPSSNPVSGRYVRIFQGSMDLLWWTGPLDGVTALDTGVEAAVAVSADRGIPLLVRDGIARVSQNLTIPAGARIQADRGAGFTASTAITMEFAVGSTFEGADNCIHGSLEPLFNIATVSAVDPDWFSDTSDSTKIDRAMSACSDGLRVLIDRKFNISGNFYQADEPVFAFEGAGELSFGSSVTNVAIKRWEGSSSSKRFSFPSLSAVSACSISFANRQEPIPFAAFGAIGDGSTDDSIPFAAACKAGKISLSTSGRYLILSEISVSSMNFVGHNYDAFASDISSESNIASPCFIFGGNVTQSSGNGSFSFRNCGIFVRSGKKIDNSAGTSGVVISSNCSIAAVDDNSIVCDSFIAIDCSITGQRIISAGNTTYSNLKDVAGSVVRFRDNSSFKTEYLEDEKNATAYDWILRTDVNGKVYGDDEIKVKRTITAEIVSTNIRFHWYNSGGTPHCDVYRDEVFVETFANDPAYYTTRSTDNPLIVVTIEGWISGWPTTSIYPSGNKPSSSVEMMIANKTPSISSIYVGETVPANMNNSARLLVPDGLFPVTTVRGLYLGSKWSF